MENEAIKLGENNHSEYNWSNNTKDKSIQLFFSISENIKRRCH